MEHAPAFAAETLVDFSSAYPKLPVKLSHDLCGDPRLTLDALAQAAARLDPALVETKRAEHFGASLTDVDRNHRAIDGFVRDVADTQAWTMLRFVDRLPEYRQLLDTLLVEIAPGIVARTGAPHTLRGFAFVSSPGTITPFHVDPEYNILFQLAGTKRITLFPYDFCLSRAADEALHGDGDNLLHWDATYARHAYSVDLSPGDAVFVPYKWPHHVVVGDAPTISLSMTWQSAWSDTQPPLHRLNARLARRGLRRVALPAWPRVPHAALFAARIADRLARR